MTELPIYYLRHNFSGSGAVDDVLLQNNLIAFHYSDEFHEGMEDYTLVEKGGERGFKIAFKAFTRMGKDSAIVVFEHKNPDYFYIATVPGGQPIQRFDFQAASREKPFVYKTLTYIDRRAFPYAQIIVLLALRPPYATICQPGLPFERIIRRLYLGYPLERSVQLLHPSFLEQLCENFLRSDFAPPTIRLLYTTAKTGKTLPTVDIVGRNAEGQILMVQISHAAGAGALEKAQKLVSLTATVPGAISILFSGDGNLTEAGLDYSFSVDAIFQVFENSPVPWHKYDAPLKQGR
jgi:hypothetical protein